MTENEYDGYDEAFINTDVPCPDEVDFSLSIPKMKSIGSVCAYIENTGDVDLENVDWEINLSYGMIFKRNKKVNGTVDEILENLGETVCTGNKFGPSSLKCGFGKMQGTVTASVGGLEKSIGFSGFMLGRIILITQQWDVEEE